MIGSKLEDLLKERNLRVADLARMTGVSPQTYYGIIRRDAFQIDIDCLVKLCRALQVDPDVFASPELIAQKDPQTEAIRSRYAQLSTLGRDMLLQRADELIQLGYTVAKNAESA